VFLFSSHSFFFLFFLLFLFNRHFLKQIGSSHFLLVPFSREGSFVCQMSFCHPNVSVEALKDCCFFVRHFSMLFSCYYQLHGYIALAYSTEIFIQYSTFSVKQFIAIVHNVEYIAAVSQSACISACGDFAICRSADLCVTFDD